MSDKIIIPTNSAMFHLPQPCTCSRQEEFGYREERENEDYQFLRNEDSADNVKRKDLPRDHWNFLEEGYYDLNAGKYLENILAPAWLDAFRETLKDRDETVKIEVKFREVSRPFEYNYETDRVCFELHIDDEDIVRIQKEVFEYKGIFEEYLQEWHSSFKDIPYGFRSFMPNSLEAWWECLGQRDRGNYEYERAITCLLEFWLFAFTYYAPKVPSLEEFTVGLKGFRDEYDRQIENLTCNGAESECFDFFPEGSKEYSYTVDHSLSGKPSEILVS
jgi:hypothetical protein